VTEAAMRGELDFERRLDARVALLAGLDEARSSAAGRSGCGHARARAIWCARCAPGRLLPAVSAGFTRFAEPVARPDRL
jgi:phosphoserine phosphatase